MRRFLSVLGAGAAAVAMLATGACSDRYNGSGVGYQANRTSDGRAIDSSQNDANRNPPAASPGGNQRSTGAAPASPGGQGAPGNGGNANGRDR